MCQCTFINNNKYTYLLWDVDDMEGSACVRVDNYIDNLHISSSFFLESKTALKGLELTMGLGGRGVLMFDHTYSRKFYKILKTCTPLSEFKIVGKNNNEYHQNYKTDDKIINKV